MNTDLEKNNNPVAPDTQLEQTKPDNQQVQPGYFDSEFPENSDINKPKQTDDTSNASSKDDVYHNNDKHHDSVNLNNEQHNPTDGKIIRESANRLLDTGKVRLTILAVCIGLVAVSGTLYLFANPLSDSGQEKVSGEVNMPKTKIGAAAIVDEQQAEYLRQQQIKEGEKAAQNGQSYLPPIVTVGEKKEEELSNPTQPGLKNPTFSERTFKDKDGRVYTAEQAAIMQQQGVKINGVTEGKGSIVDPNINNTSPQKNDTSNTGRGNSSQNPTKANEPLYEPYTVKPYTPNANVKSELVTTETETLAKVAQETDAWHDQYLAMRLKKANLINQKTTLAFTEQVGEIEKTVKPAVDTQKTMGSFSRSYYPVTTKAEPVKTVAEEKKGKVNTTEFKPLIFAGETFRAILKNEVNSDNGNEVIAELVNGPMKGSTLIGSIAKTNGNIQFNFTRLLRKGKSEINISAMGRQIGTNSSGMADDINKHYMVRYTALVVSSALSGIGESYEQTAGANASISGSGTVVTNTTDPTKDRIIGNAVGELGNELSGEVRNLTQKPPTYITKTGKIFNVFFNQNVLDGVDTEAQKIK